MHFMRYAATNDVLKARQSHFEHTSARLCHNNTMRPMQRRLHDTASTAPAANNRAQSSGVSQIAITNTVESDGVRPCDRHCQTARRMC